jgi:putative SOS response-associated peptidase YedK
MCGRYVLDSEIDKIERAFDVKFNEGALQFYQKNYNIAPTHFVCVILGETGHREVHNMRWGLVPAWLKSLEDLTFPTFNARSETITEKKTFARPFKTGKRCLVLANGYYEWKKPEKQPYYFTTYDNSIIAFAGLWERTTLNERTIESCTIITCEPNAVTKAYHNRMPVILQKEEQELWLAHDTPEDVLLALLKPCDEDFLNIYPVDKRVGNVANNDPSLIRP